MKIRILAAAVALALIVPSLAFAKKPKLKDRDEGELIELLSDSDKRMREAAAKELGHRKVDAAIDPLAKLTIEDDDSDVYVQAMWALERIGGDRGWAALQMIFETPEASEDVRRKILKKLMAKQMDRADNGVPYYLLNYKKNGVGFNVQLLKALQTLDRRDMRDLPMLIVRDRRQKRKVRVAALDAIEGLKHPGVTEAYLALLDDSDKKIKLRCIKGLSRAGLPADRVGPALEEVVRTDKQGDVRAAALAALKFYLYPELLPLVQALATSERHPMAWFHSVDMLAVLADEGSIPTIERLIGPDMYLGDGQVVHLLHALVRIGNPRVIPAIEGHMSRTESADVITECKAAIRLLSPEAASERVTIINTYTPPAEVVIYDSTAVTYGGLDLGMSVGADGAIVGVDGTHVSAGISLGGMYAGTTVTETHSSRTEVHSSDGTVTETTEVHTTTGGVPLGGVSATASIGGVRVSTGSTVTETVIIEEGPCETGVLKVGQPNGDWYNLYVDGELRIEARAMDKKKAVGGLEAGTHHIRVNEFMDNETWSEGHLTLGCGETIKAEVVEGSGLRVLNYPDHYVRQ